MSVAEALTRPRALLPQILPPEVGCALHAVAQGGTLQEPWRWWRGGALLPERVGLTLGLPPGGADGTGTDKGAPVEPTKLGVPARVNPYSIIDITPFQEEQPAPPDPEAQEEGVSLHVPSGYSVPVPCGYAVPSNLPALLPAYSSPVIVRSVSLDEEGGPFPCTVLPVPDGLRVRTSV